MFENQYNDEMEAEVRRLEAKGRALAAGHPEWDNACAVCGCELKATAISKCARCSMARVTVVAKVVAKEDCVAAVKAELLKMVPLTRLEEGCLEYRLHQDNDHPAMFVFYENWESPACLDKHLLSAHFKAYALAVEGMIAEKVVQKMTCLL